MDTAISPDASPDTSPVPPADHAAGVPEHSILSILVLLLLAAGALYLTDWGLRDDGTLVRGFELNQPLDPALWEFPDKNAVTTAQGTTFEMAESGFGPKLKLAFPAATVRWVKAEVSVVQADTGKPVRFALGWYWARSEDMSESPDGPYSLKRSMVLFPYVRHYPHSYRADMSGHDLWNGTIEGAVFTLKYPPDETGPFRVTFSRLEFLE